MRPILGKIAGFRRYEELAFDVYQPRYDGSASDYLSFICALEMYYARTLKYHGQSGVTGASFGGVQQIPYYHFVNATAWYVYNTKPTVLPVSEYFDGNSLVPDAYVLDTNYYCVSTPRKHFSPDALLWCTAPSALQQYYAELSDFDPEMEFFFLFLELPNVTGNSLHMLMAPYYKSLQEYAAWFQSILPMLLSPRNPRNKSPYGFVHALNPSEEELALMTAWNDGVLLYNKLPDFRHQAIRNELQSLVLDIMATLSRS